MSIEAAQNTAQKDQIVTVRKQRLNAVISVFGAIAIFFLAQIIAVYFIAIYLAAQGTPVTSLENWLASGVTGPFVSHLAVAAVGIALVYGLLKIVRAGWATIGLRRPQLVDIFYALIGYGWYLFLYFGTAFIVGWLLPNIDFDQEQQLGFSTEIAGTALVLVFVSLVVLPPLYEEILTRGLLFTGLKNSLPLPAAAIVTSLLFAVAHLQWGSGAPLLWVAAIDTFVLSMVLVYLKEKSGSLWPAIGLHAIKNFVAFTLLFVFKVQ